MALTLTYTDAYLKTRVTEAVETRALAEVDNLGSFPTAPINWRSTLAVIRAYIITCLELGGGPGDTFEAKLKQYRTEFDEQLVLAKSSAAQAYNSSRIVSSFSTPLERG